MDVVYKVAERASIDIDFSMGLEFTKDQLPTMEARIRAVLSDTFREIGYVVFDTKFVERPRDLPKHLETCWGGYRINFKVIEADLYDKNPDNLEFLRRNARIVGEDRKKVFQIDISKFEYCEEKAERELDGFTIFVYTPRMLVFEKVRAICQQMPMYREIVCSATFSSRARDFFDIYILLNRFPLDLEADENVILLKKIFEIKRVPIELILQIRNYRDYHRLSYDALKDTVRAGQQLKDFDFYFDYVVERLEEYAP